MQMPDGQLLTEKYGTCSSVQCHKKVSPLFPPSYGSLFFLKWRIATHYWHKVRDKKQVLTLSTPAPARIMPSSCMLPQQYIYLFIHLVPGTKTLQQSLTCTTLFPWTIAHEAPRTETPGALLYLEQRATEVRAAAWTPPSQHSRRPPPPPPPPVSIVLAL